MGYNRFRPEEDRTTHSSCRTTIRIGKHCLPCGTTSCRSILWWFSWRTWVRGLL